MYHGLTKAEKIRGYSFLEITLVLSILGLFLAISIPNFVDWLHTYRLKTAANTLANHLRQARLLAVYEGVNYQIEVKGKNQGNFYQMVQDPSGVNQVVESVGKVVVDAAYPGVFIISAPSYGKITFTPRGTSNTGSILLQNSQGEQRKVVVNNTGRVKIE